MSRTAENYIKAALPQHYEPEVEVLVDICIVDHQIQGFENSKVPCIYWTLR